MGGRITIDSATLMNKGFEAIEAHHLFGVPYERIDVVVHPQSLVHSLIDLNRRLLARPSRPSRHAGADLLRAALPRAGRRRRAAPRPCRGRRADLRGARTWRPSPACAWPARPGEAGGTAPCVLNAADEVAVAAFLDGRIPFAGDRRRDRARARRRCRPRPVGHFDDLFAADAEAREAHRRAGSGVDSGMSWLSSSSGFCLLIILHEAGHFVAAKATGMRVERFFLFFGPTIWSFKRGETEYGIKAIPLGGYVKITGMNPEEELPPEVEHRAYYRQPVWKRIVVIAAGPAVNIALAFAILFAVFLFGAQQADPVGRRSRARNARRRGLCSPATRSSRSTARLPGPRPRRGSNGSARRSARTNAPASRSTAAVRATPVDAEIERDGELRTISVRPEYDAARGRP